MNKSKIFALTIYSLLLALMGSSIKNTYQVFINTMSNDFALSRGDFLTSGAIFMLGVGVFSPVVGALSDKFGVKMTIYFGVFTTGIAFLTISFTHNFYLFVFLYGVIASFAYAAISYIPLGIIIYKNIPSGSRNLVYALVTNGTALGFIFLSPLWLLLENYYSWREILFALSFIFIIPLMLYSKYIFSFTSTNVYSSVAEAENELDSKFYLNPIFYLLIFGFFGCGLTMAYIDVHWVSQLKDSNYEAKTLSMFLVIFGTLEFAGALIAGRLLDKYNNVIILSSCYFLRLLSLLVLLLFEGSISIIIFAIIFGLSFMGTVVATTAIAVRNFPANKGFVLGLIWLSHQIGAFISVKYGGALYDANTNYDAILFLTACIALISTIISLPIYRLERKNA